MRLKLQMGAAPGILEKDLAEKIRVEESVCKVFEIWIKLKTRIFDVLLSHMKWTNSSQATTKSKVKRSCNIYE